MSTDIKNQGDDANPAAPPAATEELKNLKAEMNRKLGNLEETNKQLMALLQASQKPVQKRAEPEQDEVEKVWFDNPSKAAQLIEERTERRVAAQIAAERAAQQKQNSLISKLVNDFPELSDNENDFTKRAVELYNSMPDEYKSSPLAYENAVKEAAIERGLKPRSKRSSDENDAFALGGSRGGAERKQKKGELDPRTILTAELMGVDVEKVKARVNKRKSLTSWE